MKALDLRKHKFGRLKPILRLPSEKRGGLKRILWECLCDCGNKAIVITGQLTSGMTKSCGCLRKEVNSKRLVKDLIGKRFGRLTVICRNGISLDHGAIWKCLCDCGEKPNIKSQNLLNGRTISCGCYRKYYLSKIRVGKKHPQWQGGKSFEPYPLGWNKTHREQIRYRDKYTCQLCGVPEIECNKKLNVHHIDYDKKNINPENLVSLCNSCHTKTNHNRNKWQVILKSKQDFA